MATRPGDRQLRVEQPDAHLRLHGLVPLTRTFGSGGLDPVAAFDFSSGSGFDNLVVANNGDGTFALLEGRLEGLNLTSTDIRAGPC